MINSIVIEGRLTETPKVHRTASGSIIGSFTLVNNYKRDKLPAFIRCKVFGQSAEWISDGVKGDRVIVSGKIVAYEYEHKTKGKLSGLEVIVNDFSREYKKEFRNNNQQVFEDASAFPEQDTIPF